MDAVSLPKWVDSVAMLKILALIRDVLQSSTSAKLCYNTPTALTHHVESRAVCTNLATRDEPNLVRPIGNEVHLRGGFRDLS